MGDHEMQYPSMKSDDVIERLDAEITELTGLRSEDAKLIEELRKQVEEANAARAEAHQQRDDVLRANQTFVWAIEAVKRERDDLAAKRNALQDEVSEERGLRERLANLLERTANALKGQPHPNMLHDWSNLPEVASKLRMVVNDLQATANAWREAQREAAKWQTAYDELYGVVSGNDPLTPPPGDDVTETGQVIEVSPAVFEHVTATTHDATHPAYRTADTGHELPTAEEQERIRHHYAEMHELKCGLSLQCPCCVCRGIKCLAGHPGHDHRVSSERWKTLQRETERARQAEQRDLAEREGVIPPLD